MSAEVSVPEDWLTLVGDAENPGLLSMFTVGVLGPAGVAVTRCNECQSVQLSTGESAQPDLAILIRGAVLHLQCYHRADDQAET